MAVLTPQAGAHGLGTRLCPADLDRMLLGVEFPFLSKLLFSSFIGDFFWHSEIKINFNESIHIFIIFV